MFIIFGVRTNGETSLIGMTETDAQMRLVGESIVKSPQWKDVFFIDAKYPPLLELAKQYSLEYFMQHGEFERKLEDDPLVQALLLDQQLEPQEP